MLISVYTILKKELKQKLLPEELSFQQKSKIDWISQGDSNKQYFQASAKFWRGTNTIRWLRKEDRTCADTIESISLTTVDYFSTPITTPSSELKEVFIPWKRLTEASNNWHLCPITDKDSKCSFWSWPQQSTRPWWVHIEIFSVNLEYHQRGFYFSYKKFLWIR